MPAHIRIKPLPCFTDNYCWLVENLAHNTFILVDPADPPRILPHLPKDLECCAILTTHHHKDHSGGNEAFAATFPGLPIIGGAPEGGRIPAATRLVNHGEVVELGGLSFTSLHTPCHTQGHICYYLPGDADTPPSLFSGDTLFSGGCGRFFEGDAATMLESFGKIMALPKETRLFAGHEYTLANLKFCAAVEPCNQDIAARLVECSGLRERGLPTMPSTLEVEAKTNVFLRTHEPAVRAFTHPSLSAEERSKVPQEEVLGALREAKNKF